ncbi:toluene tolerance protein [Pseudomonas protegens]|uniref:Toluene tolerance protein n=1 Tax=Pseudomonas protegens TaxID=380021 RepID=A0A7G8YEN9_9PSED|nr:toluene tolerance protein [Pseudomonas protegens]QNH79906.1 toluene tolerance protein [Pseudomonas protegens]QNL03333.1 toluene tolerance protein [Pseudomonas protegens]
MQEIDYSTYEALRAGAQVLEADGSGDKVLRLSDGRILKLFRRKRLLSSALFYPYAKRFADNAKALKQRNIPCPQIIAVYRIPSIQRDGVYYAPLAGMTIRQLHNDTNTPNDLQRRLGQFIAFLHDKGVYFRSLHFGNVILTPENELGLIDIADLRCQPKPLSENKRLRNFTHLFRYQEDRQWLIENDSGESFLEGYRQGSHTVTRQEWLIEQLRHLLA